MKLHVELSEDWDTKEQPMKHPGEVTGNSKDDSLEHGKQNSEITRSKSFLEYIKQRSVAFVKWIDSQVLGPELVNLHPKAELYSSLTPPYPCMM